ncbi:CotH kinase family protein [Candidatus Saccharibacteria bacterium]|nr:CotH kinase family protein [Candidatus Saccharibacteria bacterium]
MKKSRRRAKERRERRKRIYRGILAIGCFLTIFLLPVGKFLANGGFSEVEQEIYQFSRLPRLEISLSGVTLEELNSGDKTIKYSGNTARLLSGTEEIELRDVELKGRGNSTWAKEKKPYQIKLKEKAEILGLGKAKKWVLLANYYDETSLRNATAFKLAEMVGEEYAPRGEFVELTIDGEELGLYYLARKTEISKNSVDLRGSEGILVELDNIHNGSDYCYFTEFGSCLIVKDVSTEDREGEIMYDFLVQFDRLELAAREGDFRTIAEILDIESLAQYYLISEFAANPDAYASSFYMHRNGKDDKIHFGPVWDFDLAFGNFRWIWREEDDILDPKILNNNIKREEEKGTIAFLIEIPEIQTEIRRVFQEKLVGKSEELISYYDFLAVQIRKAAEKDEQMWSEGYLVSFREAVLDLREWISERYEFLSKVGGV